MEDKKCRNKCGSIAAPGHTRCLFCLANLRKWIQDRNNKRKLNGKCVGCGLNPPVNGRMCLECWIGELTSLGLKQPLTDQWNKQEGRCFYTGERLTPGKNASLDHQVPTSRGGADSPLNLVWVDKTVNRMKTDMNHEEFIKTCRLIADRF